MSRTIFKPFGPSILKVKMSEELVKRINDYTDQKSKESLIGNDLDAGKDLAGNVTQEIYLNQKFMEESGFGKFLLSEVSNWISQTKNKNIKKFQITGSWIVRQYQNEYNPIHMHSGHISGVGYTKVPSNLGSTKQKNKPNKNGHLQLIHGSKSFLSNAIMDILPEVGDFYFFPHYVMHAVYPFSDTNEERRSISFNALLDDDIYFSTH
tara:strand:+ start:154 stop:777 length:624 start_codon:yes stop_codon:yes gene_type:complete